MELIITNIMSTNQNECKGSAKWKYSMFHENLNPESKHVRSRIQNLCLRHRCTTQKDSHILTPPPAPLQILSRPAFHLPCVVKDPVMTLPLWRLLLKRTQSACSQTLGGDPVKSESWRWILITASRNSLTYFALLARTAASSSPSSCTIL